MTLLAAGLAIYVTVVGDTQGLLLLVPMAAGFGFSTWYCWNIDPHYYSRPRRRR
jgi:hypothetical protein